MRCSGLWDNSIVKLPVSEYNSLYAHVHETLTNQLPSEFSEILPEKNYTEDDLQDVNKFIMSIDHNPWKIQ